MKKYLVSIVLVLFVNTVIHAQRRGGSEKGGNRSEAMINDISEQLDLDDMQKVMFEEVMNESIKERKVLRKQDLSRDEKRNKLESISEEENTAVAKILNEDQYQNFLSIKKEMRQKARDERSSRGK